MQRFTIRLEAMGKPRMTRSDKWRTRECVVRYRAYADELRRQTKGVIQNPAWVSWVAYIPMPDSWSAKKKAAMRGTLHTSKPDRDNIDKGILDALWESDQGVAAGAIIKLWGDDARIELFVAEALPAGGMPSLLDSVLPDGAVGPRLGVSHLQDFYSGVPLVCKRTPRSA